MARTNNPTRKTELESRRKRNSTIGESYSSLILGIIVVVIGTILLLSLLKNRNAIRVDDAASRGPQTVTEVSNTNMETVIRSVTAIPTPTPTPVPDPNSVDSNKSISSLKLTPTPQPKATVAKGVKSVSSPVPVKKTMSVKAKPTPTPVAMKQNTKKDSPMADRKYSVKPGETLWSIAERSYGSGYNWVDIARANKLSNPNSIKTGDNLVLPKADQKNASSEPEWVGYSSNSESANSSQMQRIAGKEYVIINGDNLWNIAVRAYGDGYRWAEIAKVNNISEPNLIYPGNKLRLPRN